MVRFLVIAASVSTVSAQQRESKECRIGNIQEMKDKYEQFGGLTMTKKKCKKKVTASGNYNHWAFQRRPIYTVIQLGKCYGFNSENFFKNTTSNCVFGKTRQTTQGRIIVEVPNEDCKGREGWTDSKGYGCDLLKKENWCSKWNQAQIDGFANDGCSASQVCDECKAGLSSCADPKDQKQNDDWKDDDGVDCRNYEINKYCTKDGSDGAGWDATYWGNISEIVGNNGKSPLVSCCACGALSGIESTTRLLQD